MREVADMAAGPLHGGPVLLDQRLDLGDQRLHFRPRRHRQRAAAAGPEPRHRTAQPPQRRQHQRYFQHGARHQPGAEHGKSHRQAAPQPLDLP